MTRPFLSRQKLATFGLAAVAIAAAVGGGGSATGAQPLPHSAALPAAHQGHLGHRVAANQTSTNWAGELASGASFTSVTASWITPKLTCDDTWRTAYAWVGLGGWGGHDALEQVGTMNWCYGGEANYSVFSEFYSNPPESVDDTRYPIAAGDAITATVAATSTAGRYKLTVSNTDEGWTYIKSGTSPDYDPSSDPGNLTGEAIVEPADGGNVHYAPITFSDISYQTEDGSTPSRGLVDTVAGGDTLATATRTSDGVEVTWKGTGPING